MKRTAQWYFFVVSVMGLGIFFMLHLGSQLAPPVSPPSTNFVAHSTEHLADIGDSSFSASVEANLQENANDPLSRLFLQLFVVIAVCYVIGWIFTRCRQPFQYRCYLFPWSAAGVVPLWPSRSAGSIVYGLCLVHGNFHEHYRLSC